MLPVVIVGAGPVGLTVALLLARQQIPFRIIDKASAPSTTSKALGIHARTQDLLDDLGLLERFEQQGRALTGINMYNQQGERLATVHCEAINGVPHAGILVVPQSETEALLLDALEQYEHTVERGVSLQAYQQHDEHVDLTLQYADGRTETLQTEWLLGCDGFHSQVRAGANIDYQGDDLSSRFLMMDATIDWPLDQQHIHILFHPQGAAAVFPMRDLQRIVIEVSQDKNVPEQAQATPELITELVKRRWQLSFSASEVSWLSHFYIHERLVNHYRDQRIFVLGDAAHVHSPAGGQGMNTGMQDAYNLTWKLAQVINGQLKSTLLDSYQQERRPVAQAVLAASTRLTKMAALNRSIKCWLRDKLIKFVLGFKKAQRVMLMQLSGLQIHYSDSVLSQDKVSTTLKAGQRAPTIVKGEQFSLFISEQCPDRGKIEAWLQQQQLPITLEIIPVTESRHAVYALAEHYCLIRPDQYIAHSGKVLEDLQCYCRQIFTINPHKE